MIPTIRILAPHSALLSTGSAPFSLLDFIRAQLRWVLHLDHGIIIIITTIHPLHQALSKCNWCMFKITKINHFVSVLTQAFQVQNTYFFFGGVCFLGAIFVIFCVPETKGRTEEDMKAIFSKWEDSDILKGIMLVLASYHKLRLPHSRSSQIPQSWDFILIVQRVPRSSSHPSATALFFLLCKKETFDLDLVHSLHPKWLHQIHWQK